MNTINGMNLWKENDSPVSDFRRDFDRLFSDWLTPGSPGLRTDAHFVPACDVEEQDDHYLLTLEMAGMKRDDIKMEVMGNQITISGERRNDAGRKGDELTYSERRFGRFQRAFSLPTGVDSAQIEASYQDGILRVVVPKAESARPRQIKITNGSGGSKFLGKFLSQSKEKEEQHSSNVADRVAS